VVRAVAAVDAAIRVVTWLGYGVDDVSRARLMV
jgi:hypothetical protein